MATNIACHIPSLLDSLISRRQQEQFKTTARVMQDNSKGNMTCKQGPCKRKKRAMQKNSNSKAGKYHKQNDSESIAKGEQGQCNMAAEAMQDNSQGNERLQHGQCKTRVELLASRLGRGGGGGGGPPDLVQEEGIEGGNVIPQLCAGRQGDSSRHKGAIQAAVLQHCPEGLHNIAANTAAGF